MHILVREMQPDEKGDVEKLFERSLGIIDRIVFRLSFKDAQKRARKQNGGTLIAECDSKVVGTVSMRIQIIKGARTGYIDALVTDKKFRGRGIGKSLVDGAISWLEKHGCEVIHATADRYNSPSWNIFIHRGFNLYEFPQQFRDYGLSFLQLWLGEFHFIGYGTFFLRSGKEAEKPCETREAWHWLGALLGVSTVWWIQLLRGREPLMLFPALFAVVAVSLLTHEFSQKLVARRLTLQTTFKAWGSGILFSWLLALVGVFFPAYGSTYVKQPDWWYDSAKDKTGIVFTVGPLVSLMLGLVFWVVQNLAIDSLLMTVARVGYATSLIIVIFNLIPIQAAGGFVWDGKKILKWNKTVWSALVIATATLIILDIFF